MGQMTRLGGKHCEDECNFPSSCHWREEHAAPDTVIAFHDPGSLDKEPDASSVRCSLAVPKGTEDYIGKIRETAGKRTRQVASAILSPIEEEDQKASWFLDTTPRLNGLGLHCPVMDFSSSKTDADESLEVVDQREMKLTTPKSPHILGRVGDVWEEDVDMTDWITKDGTANGAMSPCGEPEAIEVPFDFRLEQDDGLAASVVDDDLPCLATWNWTAGGIGVALSPPDLAVEGGM